MDLFGIFRIAIRRWYVLVAALVVTGLLGFVASTQVAPSYSVSGVLVVNIPYAQDQEAAARLAGNPYYDTRTAASVMGSIADSPDVRDVVAKAGGSPDYVINVDSGRPLLLITITAKSQQATLSTYSLLWKELQKRMQDLQTAKQIPDQFRVTVDDALQPREAAVSSGSRTKVLLAALAIGVVLALGLSVYVDYLLRRRELQAAEAAAAAPPDPKPDEEAVDETAIEWPDEPAESGPDRTATPLSDQPTRKLRPVSANGKVKAGARGNSERSR
ncbi:hypothetical protein [Amycolatopsis jejuensis]|uniref:hypothetical protein n=1 Tax=Amycolatopsis jejuensis TaxID=330084 RepID=UPI00068CCDEB|nr:hypothetical protein [Amycolatopsis jejuensis]